MSEKINGFFLVKEHFNTKCSKLGKVSLQETLSSVTNSSILENAQVSRVTGYCYGYCDNFSVIGVFSWVHLIWLANVTVRLQVSDTITTNCPITLSDYNPIYTMISGKQSPLNARPVKFEELLMVMIKLHSPDIVMLKK